MVGAVTFIAITRLSTQKYALENGFYYKVVF